MSKKKLLTQIAFLIFYPNITKLDAEIIRTFIEKIYVYTVNDNLGKKVKKLKIVFNFIGEINLPSKN